MANKARIKAAEKSLAEFLTSQFEQKPVGMKCMHEFEMNGLIYCVLKYRKSLFGADYIGICGGFEGDSTEHCGQVFGTYEAEYKEETAVEDGKKMLLSLLRFQQQKLHKEHMQECFEANLKYISQTEIFADVIAGQFVKTNSRFYLKIGTADIPSGRVVVADPLAYMAGSHVIAPTLEKEISKGSYPVEISLFRSNIMGVRICTARLKIKPTAAVRYELAKPLTGTEAAKDFTGYPVDAGMMCFCDSEVANDYSRFIDEWHRNNPNKNHYDDYFAALFAQSAEKLSQFQSEDGDFIEWTLPETGQRIVMMSSGLGDGFYQCFWGYDESGEICELISPMVNPDIFEGAD